MLIRKGYRFCLKPKPHHEAKLRQSSGCSRFVWNKALAIQKERLANKQFYLSYNELAGLLVDWKKDRDLCFLSAVHSQPLQQTLKDLYRAIRDAFDKTSRFPKFKKKGTHDSFRYPQSFVINGNVIYLPKIGWVPFFKSREIEGTPKNITVSRHGKHWYVAIQVEIEVADPVHPSKNAVGIDMGVTRFATLSNGTFFEPLNSLKTLGTKLAKQQRKLFQKVKFSKNWHKQRARVNAVHARIAAARKDYLHKISTTISKNHALVAMEALKVINMSSTARGTKENPGKKVRQKSALNKAILDQGWYEFRRMLDYKQWWRGGHLVVVPPQHTSQRCPECGHIHPNNRSSQSVFRCLRCRYTANADYVAALNILAAGHAVLACGEVGAVRPLDEAGTRKEAA
ncbi:MAG: RNA-guided endonuclease InsQ/TnpB family protein [Thermodesulfovibrionales bacterium]